jgi:uncharacterized membrane protein YhhN
VILGLAASLALLFWTICSRDHHDWPGSAIKTCSTALLAVYGLIEGAPPLIVAGLALGSLGDLCLSRRGETTFLLGMSAFAMGHLAYAVAFWTAGNLSPVLVAALPLLALAATTEIWLAPNTGTLRWPVRAYVAIIVGMGLTAASLKGAALVKGGVLLFIISDLLLAIHMFRCPSPWLARTLWPAYWIGQALILLGSL